MQVQRLQNQVDAGGQGDALQMQEMLLPQASVAGQPPVHLRPQGGEVASLEGAAEGCQF